MYKTQSSFINGFAIVQNQKDLYGAINAKGEEVLACIYDNLYFGLHHTIFVEKDAKFGVFQNEKFVIPIEYDALNEYNTLINVITEGIVTLTTLYHYNNQITLISANNDFVIDGEFDELYLIFNENNGKYGLMNKKCEIVLPLEYVDIIQSEGGTSFHIYQNIKKKRCLGIANLKGEVIIPCQYEYLCDSPAWGHKKYIFFNDHKGKMGAVDTKGNIIIPFEYENLRPCTENTFIASKKENQQYVINLKQEKISETYHEIVVQSEKLISCNLGEKGNYLNLLLDSHTLKPYSEEKFYFVEGGGYGSGIYTTQKNSLVVSQLSKKNDNYYGIFDFKTNTLIVPCKYAMIANTLVDDVFVFQKEENDKFGLIDQHANILIKPQYDNITSDYTMLKEYFSALKNGEYGIIDQKNNIIFPFKYGEIIELRKEGKELVLEAKNYFCIDKNNKIQPDYEKRSEVYYDLLAGYDYDNYGEAIIPPSNPFPEPKNPLGLKIIDNKKSKEKGTKTLFGIADKSEKIIHEYQYSELEYVGENIFKTKQGKYFGLIEYIDNKFEILLSNDYQKIDYTPKGTLITFPKKKNKEPEIKLAHITREGKLNKIREQFIACSEYSTPAQEGFRIFKEEFETYNFCNWEGEEIIASEHSEMQDCFVNDRLFATDDNGKYGYFDTKGNIAIPFEYDAATAFVDGYALVEKNITEKRSPPTPKGGV